MRRVLRKSGQLGETNRDALIRVYDEADYGSAAFVELEWAIRAARRGDSDATKDVIERPLDAQQPICSVERSCVPHAFRTPYSD